MEKDPERGYDSLATFEEILQIAQEKQVFINWYTGLMKWMQYLEALGWEFYSKEPVYEIAAIFFVYYDVVIIFRQL